MEAYVRDALQQQTFDLVIASEIGPGLCTTPHVVGSSAVPLVIEDLELSMIWNAIGAQDTWLGRIRHRLTWWKQRQYAISLLHQVQGCTVASEQERDLLQSIAPGFEALAVVPNGLDLELYEGDWPPSKSDALIFPGALTYKANFAAMSFFLEAVFPLIQLRCPEAILRITGRTSGVSLNQLPANESVVFTGYVEDVRPVIAQSRACVVPLLTGGGTRLKILEAMALGTPVVSTSRGAEGLEATPGEHFLVADEPEEFADAVVRLVNDDALHNRLRENGRSLVQAQYDWVSIGNQLNGFLDEIVVRHQDDCQAGGRDKVEVVTDCGWISSADR
jgi:glycosyltransferase involved in cell wall biosynthesis